LAVIAVTDDERFARRVAREHLRLEASTGALVRGRRWWTWRWRG
jgi:hypothetical protein